MKQDLNCGSCMFLNRERCFERKCSSLGKLPTNKACGSHKPDMFTLVGTGQKLDRIHKVAEAVHGLSANDLQIFGAVLHAERNTRKAGWRFMQKVYVRYAGSSNRNYMSNFLIGYVLYADKEYVRVVGENGKMFLSVLNDDDGNTLYTAAKFRPIREAMLRDKRYVDPEFGRGNTGRIPKLDDVVNDDVSMRKQVKKSRASEDDLVSIVSRMGRGLLKTSKRRNTNARTGGSELSFKW